MLQPREFDIASQLQLTLLPLIVLFIVHISAAAPSRPLQKKTKLAKDDNQEERRQLYSLKDSPQQFMVFIPAV